MSNVKEYLLMSFIANIEISLESVWIFLKYFGPPRRDAPWERPYLPENQP